MRKSLLLTTSLAVLLGAGNALADQILINTDADPSYKVDGNQTISNGTLNNNSGGAIKALGGFSAGDNLTVSGNEVVRGTSGGLGGGIYVRLKPNTGSTEHTASKKVEIGENAIFKNNKASDFGGGLAVEVAEEGVVIGNGAKFEGNTAGIAGGAIATWEDNPNDAPTTITLGKTEFLNNSAKAGGAIANLSTKNTINVGSDSKFTGNSSQVFGGAILNYGTMNISKSTFSENKVLDANDGYGGAIFNQSGVLTISGTEFNKNVAAVDGGAISSTTPYLNASERPDDYTAAGYSEEEVRAYWESKNGYGAKNKIVITDSKFNENSAGYSGGALGVYSDAEISGTNFNFNSADGSGKQDGGGAIYAGGWARIDVKDSFFKGNKAVYGGAIATTQAGLEKGAYIKTDNVTFEKNHAFKNGGAILNKFVSSEIKDTTFSENNADDKGGAIYNIGSIAFNGNNSFTNNTATNGGNDIWNDGVLNFNSGTTTFDGGIAGDGTINVAGGATLDIGTSSVLAKDITFNSGSTLKLDIKGSAEHGYIKASNDFTAQSGSVLNPVLEQGLFKDGFSVKLFEGTNVSDQFGGFDISNAMYEFRGNGEGLYEVVQINKASDLVDGETSGAASAWTDGNAFTGGTQKEVADKLAELAQTNPAAYQEALKALTPGKHNIVQGATTDHTNQVIGAVESRLSGGCSFFCTGSEGRASGDNVFNTAMSWVQGLFNKSKLSRNDGFDSKSTGIALGFEDYINDNSKLGVGYAFTNTDVDSVDGRNTDIDTHTVFVYGEYKPSKWFINGYAGYNFADYDESSVLKNASYDVNSISL